MEEQIRREWLDYEEAIQLTGLSRHTIWRAVKAGRITAYKVGTRVMISRESLESYVRAEPVPVAK